MERTQLTSEITTTFAQVTVKEKDFDAELVHGHPQFVALQENVTG